MNVRLKSKEKSNVKLLPVSLLTCLIRITCDTIFFSSFTLKDLYANSLADFKFKLAGGIEVCINKSSVEQI